MPTTPSSLSFADPPGSPGGESLRQRLARRDPADWPFILDELRTIASSVAPSFRDVCSADDALGELALRTHERWLEDWLAAPAVPFRLFLRDRLRDHLRELRRQRDRRASLIAGVLPGAAHVETEAGPRAALFASAPPQPDEALEARELHRDVALVTGAPSQILDLRAAGFDQHEIASRTGLSRPTVGRRLAAIATVMVALAASGALFAMHRGSARSELEVEPLRELHQLPGAPPATPELAPATPPELAPATPPELAPPTTQPEQPLRPGPDAPSRLARPPRTALGGTDNASVSVDDEARTCIGNGDNACVIRLLGNGRARTARQLALLAQAQRALTGVRSSCPTIRRLLQEFPASPEAARYRAIHVTQCQGR